MFWVALASLFFFPLFLPKLQLLFFAPYLITRLYKKELMPALWRGVFCGVIVDLFASSPFFGLSALTYVLASLALRLQTRNFFEDKLATLSLMTALFSIIVTFVSALFLLIFGQQCLFSMQWIVTDLFEMALIDAVYALIFFSIPLRVIRLVSTAHLRSKFSKKRHSRLD
ncbi:MAG: mreD [Chlamydiales bacterium]|nr:mreD [Chlamydiales bacterium]